MKEIERRTTYQPKQVDQGFNAVKAADITPSLRANQQTELQNMKNQADAQLRTMDFNRQLLKFQDQAEQQELQQLTQFSGQLFDFVQNLEKQRISNKAAEAQVLYSELEEERNAALISQNAFEAQLSDATNTDTKLALGATAKGAPFDIANEINKRSGHEKYFLTVIHAQKTAANFEGWASTEKQRNNGTINVGGVQVQINNPRNRAEAAAVDSYLLKEYLKQEGVEHVAPGISAKYIFPETDKAKNSLMAKWEKQHALDETFRNDQIGFEKLKATYATNPDAVQQYLNLVKLGVTGKGAARTFTHAHDAFWEEVTALAQSGDTQDQQMADALIAQYGATKFNGVPFSILQKDRINKFTREKLNYDTKTRELERTARKSAADNKIREMLVAVGPNGTKQEYADIIRYGEKMYASFGEVFDGSNLKKAWEKNSISGQAYADLRSLTALKLQNGRFTESDWENLPAGLQEEFATQWKSHQKLQEQQHKTNIETIEGWVDSNRYSNTPGSNKGANGDLVKRDLVSQYHQMVKDMVEDPDHPFHGDYDKAGLKALQDLEKTFNASVGKQGTKYYHGMNGFENIIGDILGDDIRGMTERHRNKAREIYNQYKVIGKSLWSKPNRLGSDEYLRRMKEGAENGEVDAFLQKVAQTTGTPWMEILNEQLRQSRIDPVLEVVQLVEQINAARPEKQAELKQLFNGFGTEVMKLRLSGSQSVRPVWQAQLPSPERYQSLTAMEPTEFSSKPVRQRGEFLMDYMTKDLGMSQFHALGLLANAMRESTFTTTIAGDNGLSNGMFQWHKSRLDSARAALGSKWDDPRAQIKYALEEPGEPGQEYLNMTFRSAQEAADWWAKYWERPADLTRDSAVHRSFLANWSRGGV